MMADFATKMFIFVSWFGLGCEARFDTDLPFENVISNIRYELNDCIESLSDLNTCLQNRNPLLRKLRNCDQILQDAYACMSVLPALKKTLMTYGFDNTDDVVLPDAIRSLSSYPHVNDVTFLVPEEGQSGHAQYEDEDDENDRLGPLVKRGLGLCIHKCLKGPSGMSFIQCKSMCHR